MYPASPAYLARVQLDDRTFHFRAFVQPVNGTAFWIYDNDLVENNLSLSEQVVPGDAIAFGGTVAASFEVEFQNPDGLYDGIQFNGAQINPSVGLELDDGTTEWVPLGVFLVDNVAHAVPYQRVQVNTIRLQAMDRLIMLEEPFADVNTSFPISAGGLLTAVCTHCGLSRTASATNFLNKDFIIATRPDGDMSCRDIVGYIAELAGCFARATRTGDLEFVWFKNPAADTPDTALQPLGRINFAIDDTPITVSGVSYETDDGTLRVGEDDGTHDIALSDNPLISGNPEHILQSLYNVVEGFSYLPCNTDRHDDPALQAGDMVLHPDVNGVDYKSIVTAYSYKLHGVCKLEASGLSAVTAGWRSKFQKRVSTLQRRISAVESGELDAYTDAVGLAFGMLAGVTGGHFIRGDDTGDPQYAGKFFLADNPDITQARDIWQYSSGGIGHFMDGINSPPQSAWTADGRLVMPLVYANQVFAGILSSINGQSFFDLSNNLLQTDNINVTGGSINISGDDTQTIIDGDGLTANFVHSKGIIAWNNFFMQETENGDLAIFSV